MSMLDYCENIFIGSVAEFLKVGNKFINVDEIQTIDLDKNLLTLVDEREIYLEEDDVIQLEKYFNKFVLKEYEELLKKNGKNEKEGKDDDEN